ncbi:MAG: PilZ domain-containing protein [Candidatus Aminicenantes bacterium]|nr:PilZ domain-containing protein [Candidatus Aminicenantes bacterium]
MERRIEKREKNENQVQITISTNYDIPTNKRILYRLTKDISKNGMKLMVDTFMPKGILLRISLFLKDPHRCMRIIGEVKWIRNMYSNENFEMGIKFLDVSQEDARILKKYIEDISDGERRWKEIEKKAGKSES